MIIDFMKKKNEVDEVHNSILASYREMYVLKKIIDYINNKPQNERHYYRSNIPDKDQCAICYKKGFVTHTIHLPKEEINLCNKCFKILPENLLSAVKVD